MKMKSFILAGLSIMMMAVVSVFGAAVDNNSDAASGSDQASDEIITVESDPVSMVGGWELAGWTDEDSLLSDTEKEVFDKAIKDVTDITYVPVMCMATQVVAGENFCFLVQATDEAKNMTRYEYLYVYNDLEGNAQLMGTVPVEIGLPL